MSLQRHVLMEGHRPAAVDSLGYGSSWLEHGKTGVVCRSQLVCSAAALWAMRSCWLQHPTEQSLCVCIYVAQAGLNLVTPLACAV